MCKRNTLQRAMTLNAVMCLKNHPTADEVYDYVRAEYPQISRATVYRNLNKLCEDGKLARVKISGSADRFDHKLEAHYHFICNKCKKITDLDIPYMDGINSMCSGIEGRRVNAHQILFDGICKECLEKGK